MPGHLGAVSLKKSHDIVILSFCNIVKGQAKCLQFRPNRAWWGISGTFLPKKLSYVYNLEVGQKNYGCRCTHKTNKFIALVSNQIRLEGVRTCSIINKLESDFFFGNQNSTFYRRNGGAEKGKALLREK